MKKKKKKKKRNKKEEEKEKEEKKRNNNNNNNNNNLGKYEIRGIRLRFCNLYVFIGRGDVCSVFV